MAAVESVIARILAAGIGLAGGMVVGSALVAFLAVLDVVPRLAQLTRSYAKLSVYESALIVGGATFTLVDFFEWNLASVAAGIGNGIFAAIFGLLGGCFVGMLAAGLTEVLNVLPILARRLGMPGFLVWLLMAMVCGKVIGSLFDWLFFQSLSP